MWKRTLVPILVLSLWPAVGAHAVASEAPEALSEKPPRGAAAVAAASPPRHAFVAVRAAGRGAQFDGTVHVDAAAQRLGLNFRFNPPDEDLLWARVWVGERTDSGCTREVVLQGTSEQTGSWSAQEADGTPVTVTADYSEDTASSHLVRLQLDRPNLPNGCARAEWWEGTDAGPTARVVKAPSRRTFRLNGSPLVKAPRQLSLPWGETSVTNITVREYEWAPSILEELSVSLGRRTAATGRSEPIAVWDFWRDGPARIELPVTPAEPWGTHVGLRLTTTALGTIPTDWIRVWIQHPPPTDWVGSLSGTRVWRPKTDLWSGHPEQPTMTFVDDQWVHLAANSTRLQSPTCTAVSEEWNQGCHRYWYDADTGRLQIDDLRARVTERGWWWQGRGWDTSYGVRTLHTGATRRFHGTGDTLPCVRPDRTGCAYFAPAEVWLTKDGSYRWTRGNRSERGHYEAVADSRVQLDPGRPGGRTRAVPLGIFGRVVDGEWRVLRFRLGNTVTRPSSTSRSGG